jgi:hypothetical protein
LRNQPSPSMWAGLNKTFMPALASVTKLPRI